MKKNMLVLTVVLVSLVGLGVKADAQQVEKDTKQDKATNSVATPEDPASRADLRKATRQMEAEVRKVGEKSAEQLKALAVEAEKARLEAQRLHNESLRKAEEAQKKTLDAIAQAKVREEVERQRFLYGVGGSVAVLVIAMAILGFVVARRKPATVEVTAVQTVERKEEVLVDPDIPALREYSERNGGRKLVPFVLTLPEQGVQFNCIAELRSAQIPLVRFEGEEIPTVWEKRKQKAKELFLQGKGTKITEKVAS